MPVYKYVTDLCDQGDVFYDQDGGALLVPRSDSGSYIHVCSDYANML